MKKFKIIIHTDEGQHKGETTVNSRDDNVWTLQDAEEYAKKITHKGEYAFVYEE